MATLAPPRSIQQRMDALVRANDTRLRRVALKRDVKAGRVEAANLVLDPPSFIETMKLYDLLLSMPKYGTVRANKTLKRCHISAVKTIGGLSPRQRNEVASLLGGWQ